jgi:hypothetical protein
MTSNPTNPPRKEDGPLATLQCSTSAKHRPKIRAQEPEH